MHVSWNVPKRDPAPICGCKEANRVEVDEVHLLEIQRNRYWHVGDPYLQLLHIRGADSPDEHEDRLGLRLDHFDPQHHRDQYSAKGMPRAK